MTIIQRCDHNSVLFSCYRGDLLPDGAEEGFSGGAGLSSTGPRVSRWMSCHFCSPQWEKAKTTTLDVGYRLFAGREIVVSLYNCCNGAVRQYFILYFHLVALEVVIGVSRTVTAGLERLEMLLWWGTRAEARKASWSTSSNMPPKSSLVSTSMRSHTRISGEPSWDPGGSDRGLRGQSNWMSCQLCLWVMSSAWEGRAWPRFCTVWWSGDGYGSPLLVQRPYRSMFMFQSKNCSVLFVWKRSSFCHLNLLGTGISRKWPWSGTGKLYCSLPPSTVSGTFRPWFTEWKRDACLTSLWRCFLAQEVTPPPRHTAS